MIEAPPQARMLVMAGPGTGKTEVVARRLVHLLHHGVKPAGILVLSFSRSAVRTLASRIQNLVDEESAALQELRHVSVRTFDSWSFRMLRHLGANPAELLRRGYIDNIRQIVQEIEGSSARKVAERLAHVRHVFIDEFQDLGGVRGALVMSLLRLIAPPGSREVGFTILGDDAQAIYGFALKDLEDGYKDLTPKVLWRQLQERYAKDLREVVLEKNYRATESLAKVVEAARSIIRRDTSGEKKLDAMRKIFTRVPEVAASQLTTSEPEPANPYSVGVLCRTNGQALRVAEKLMGNQDEPPPMPVQLSAGSPSRVIPAWIGATLGRFKGATLTRDNFARIHERLYPTDEVRRQVGVPSVDVAWNLLKRASSDAHSAVESIEIESLRARLQWLDVLPDDEGGLRKAVEILTVHQSKGMEYDVVGVVDRAGEGGNRRTRADVETDPEEEANVLFVALSRAATTLKRISGDGIYPLSARPFDKGSRTRWYNWRYGWVNLEIGISGDVDVNSLVSERNFEDGPKALAAQEWLAGNAATVRGHKVVLVKVPMAGHERKFVYAIHLQERGQPGRLLATTTPQLTFDLLSILHNRERDYHYPLPKYIYNLRVTDVTTVIVPSSGAVDVLSPWKESGLWVGIAIHGIGAFKT